MPSKKRQPAVPLLEPPTFESAALTQRAQLLYRLSFMAFAVGTAVMVLLIVVLSDYAVRWLALLFVVDIIAALTIMIVRQRHVTGAAVFQLVAFWVVLSDAAWTNGGVSAPSIAAQLVLVMVAGMLLGRRGALAAAGVSAVTVIFIANAEAAQHLPKPAAVHTPASSAVILIGLLVVVGFLISAVMRMLLREQARVSGYHEAEQAAEREAARSAARVRTLQAVAEATTAGRSPSDMCSDVLDAFGAHLGLRIGLVYQFDGTGEGLRLIASHGLDADYERSVSTLPADEDSPILVVKSALTGGVAQGADVAVTEQQQPASDKAELPDTRHIAVPIECNSDVTGAIGLAFLGSEDFTAEEIGLFSSVARMVGQAFATAGSSGEQRTPSGPAEGDDVERDAQAEVASEPLVVQADHGLPDEDEYEVSLNAVGELMRSAGGLDEAMQQAMAEITRALGVDVSAVHVCADGQWKFEYADNLPGPFREVLLTSDEARLSAKIGESGAPLVVEDVTSDGHPDARLIEPFGITAFIAVPLRAEDRVMGVLYTGRLGGDARFAAEQTDFTRRAADILLRALQKAEDSPSRQGAADGQ